MPSIAYESFAFWSNYHMTRSFPSLDVERVQHAGPPPPRIPPLIGVKHQGRIYCADVDHLPILERFGHMGGTLQDHLDDLEKFIRDNPTGGGPVAAGLIGKGWSFSKVIGTPVSQLICDGMTGAGMLEQADCAAASLPERETIALVAGGTRLRELVRFAETRNLTIPTSGTHMGPTMAGCIATASHGSKIGFGGVQNAVVGMHIITGKARHVWLERKKQPVLSTAGLAKLAIPRPDGGTLPVTLLQDDDLFEAALVHLGGMGVVCGLAVRLVDNGYYNRLLAHRQLTPEVLKQIDRRDFRGIAKSLQCDADPAFYELTVNPADPFGEKSLHTMYFASPVMPLVDDGDAATTHPGDAIAQLASALTSDQIIEMFEQALQHIPAADPEKMDPEKSAGEPPWDLILAEFFKGDKSAFAYYARIGGFGAVAGPRVPGEPGWANHTWSQLHPHDVITGGVPGALYNASFAIPVEKVSVAVPAICAAVKGLPGSFVFTLRFVDDATGTLAFTRFRHCAVIEIDGISPFICDHKADELTGGDEQSQMARQLLWALAPVVDEGARLVRKALDGAGVPFSMHWGKLGKLDRAKVQADFGKGGALSPIAQWQKARDKLLTPEGKQFFWNEALREWGLA